MQTVKHIYVDELAEWLKAQGSDNKDSNAILDGLEVLFELETALQEYFDE